MVQNEPFEKLPISYKPVRRSGHYPPTLSFGFAIPDEFTQFLRVAIENNLGDAEKLRARGRFRKLQNLVIPYLNERCGLSSKEGINCEYVYSREAAFVLEVKTNHVSSGEGG